jgi:site-specific DNA-methyltransferase (adenine-specific)
MVAGRAAWGDVGGDPIVSHKRNSKIVTEKDSWETPQWLFDLLDQEFHFLVDAAATSENAHCNLYMGSDNQPAHAFCIGNALTKLDWTPRCSNFFLNPPYSAGNIDKFMAKALEESQKGAVVVCLVPCATDTKWWHQYSMKAQEIRFIKGRVRFVGYDEDGNQVKNSPTFSSCVVIFNRDLSRGYPIIGTTIEQPKRTKP